MRTCRVGWATPILALILLMSAALRAYGLDWDGGHWLHPDERQIYFITLGLGWPSSLAEALSPESPLNPGFFAYGSFPFYLLKLANAILAPFWPAIRDPDNLHLVGRPLALLFDLGTIYLTYRLARMFLPFTRFHRAPREGALLAAALAGLAVLHVQLAHFFTPDPILVFFVLLVLNLATSVAQGSGCVYQVILGIALGLGMATKLTTAPLVVPILFACYLRGSGRLKHARRREGDQAGLRSQASSAIRCIFVTLAPAILVFFAVQPYAIIDWRTFLADTMRESQIAWGWLDAPYTRQYAGTLPYLYSMWQMALWGMALPLGLLAWIGFGLALVYWLRRGFWIEAVPLAWAGPYLAVTGLLYARYLRYMLPLIPPLCLLVVPLLSIRRIRDTPAAAEQAPALRRAWLPISAIVLLILASLVYALAFASIYAEPHSWITSSEWIYRKIQAGSTLAVEEWDTALPLPLDVDGQPRRIEEYDVRTLALYAEPDDTSKWEALAGQLAESDYLIIASRRLYGSIPRQPDRYPLSTRYYELLFAGELGFELAAEFTRGPAWLNPRLPPLPDADPRLLHPDESYVVYDHPRTMVLRNAERLPAEELLGKLR